MTNKKIKREKRNIIKPELLGLPILSERFMINDKEFSIFNVFFLIDMLYQECHNKEKLFDALRIYKGYDMLIKLADDVITCNEKTTTLENNLESMGYTMNTVKEFHLLNNIGKDKKMTILYLKNCKEDDLFYIIEKHCKKEPVYMKYKNAILHLCMFKVNDKYHIMPVETPIVQIKKTLNNEFEEECNICFEKVNSVFVCTHCSYNMCQGCKNILKECPICKQKICDVLKII